MSEDTDKGLWLRHKSKIGSTVSIHIQTPNKVFKSPVEGTRPYVDVFEGPMQEALDLLDKEEDVLIYTGTLKKDKDPLVEAHIKLNEKTED